MVRTKEYVCAGPSDTIKAGWVGVEFKRYIDGIIATIVRLDATADDVVLANADGKTAFSSRPTEDCDVGGNGIRRCNHRIWFYILLIWGKRRKLFNLFVLITFFLNLSDYKIANWLWTTVNIFRTW